MVDNSAIDEIALAGSAAPKRPSQLSDFWSSFSENKGAVAGLVVVVIIALMAIFAPIVAPHSPIEQFRDFTKLPPVWETGGRWAFPLGTDALGRDALSRLIYGARISLFIGLMVMSVSIVIGVILGLIATFAGGIVDIVIMRIMDLIIAIPSLVLAILVVAILGPNLENTIVAVTIVYMPRYVRLVRGSALGEIGKDYVTAARVIGVGTLRLMFVTVLPNCLAPLIVQAALGVSDAILEAAALGFLGLGAQPPIPEWGAMLADNREFIRSNPWIVTLPGLAILITVVAVNIMGDGLRDALDPRLKRGERMPKLDLTNLPFDQAISDLTLLGLLALVGYVAPRLYEFLRDRNTRQKQLDALLIQLQLELARARPTTEMYCSAEFESMMAAAIDEHAAAALPFRPFIPMVYREEKYVAWENLIIDLPKHVLTDIQDYIANSRLIYVLITRLQSDEFEKLMPKRQKAAITGLVRINIKHLRTCNSLAAHLARYELYGRRPWLDPNHLDVKR